MKRVAQASALLLCTAPLWAYADPVTIASLAVYALAASGAIAATTAAWALFAIAVYGTIDAQRKARQARSRARNEFNGSLTERNITALQADPHWRIVYGRQNSGGDVVGIFTSDKTATRTDGTTYIKADAIKHLVVVFAAHEIQAFNEIYLDGIALGTLDSNGFVTGGEFMLTRTENREISIAPGASSTQPYPVTVMNCWDETLSGTDGGTMLAGSFTLGGGSTIINNIGVNPCRVVFTMAVGWPTVQVHKHLGSPTQTADAFLMAAVPSEWTATDRLQGLPYLVLTLDLENTRFFGGPPNATVDLSGRLVLDTRTGVTAWSQNNALIVRDFLTAEWGFNCLASDIDVAYCNAAANACDVPITLTIGASATPGQPTYTCNGSFTTAESREAVLADLCESMAGYATYGAQWLIQAGAWTVPGRGLTDSDLDGQIELVQGGAGMDEIFNSVRGSYVPLQSSVVSDFDVYQNATFVAADGQALYTDITLPFTNNKARCRNLARVFTERNRDSQIIRYPAKLSAFTLQIGERVTVTSGEYGFNAKEYRVTDWQFGITAPVQLLLQEDSAANYDLADAATSDPAANTGLPNPYLVSALTGVSAASGTTNQVRLEDNSVQQRVRVSWTAITDPWLTDGTGFVYVQWRRQYRDPANVWQTLRVSANEVQAYIPAVAIGDSLTIDVWAENGLKIRGPSVYASVVVSGTAQLVTTQMLGAGAATNVQSAEPVDGSVSWPGNPTVDLLNPASTDVFALSYTNNTGRTVSMEMSSAISAYGSGSGGTAGVSLEMRAVWSKTVAGTSSTKKYPIVGATAAAIDSMSYPSSTTLAAGDTIIFSGEVGGYNSAAGIVPAGSVNWSNATARLTAVLV